MSIFGDGSLFNFSGSMFKKKSKKDQVGNGKTVNKKASNTDLKTRGRQIMAGGAIPSEASVTRTNGGFKNDGPTNRAQSKNPKANSAITSTRTSGTSPSRGLLKQVEKTWTPTTPAKKRPTTPSTKVNSSSVKPPSNKPQIKAETVKSLPKVTPLQNRDPSPKGKGSVAKAKSRPTSPSSKVAPSSKTRKVKQGKGTTNVKLLTTEERKKVSTRGRK